MFWKSKPIEETYEKLCKTPSDINKHLPVLRKYGKKVNTITELGVRHGISTTAWIASRPRVFTCYDLRRNRKTFNLRLYKKWAKELKIDFKFINKDVLKVTLNPTELLFIDTYHTYDQLSQELAMHAGKASKYIILHDTVSCGEIGEDGQAPGLTKAINEFLSASSGWKIKELYKNNNGLVILEKGSQNLNLNG